MFAKAEVVDNEFSPDSKNWYSLMQGEKQFYIYFTGELFGGDYADKKSCALKLLSLYSRIGSDCVAKLSGNFAFAIYEKHSKKLFVARDHFGTKPFFYAHIGNKFIFATSINAVKNSNLLKPRLSQSGIAELFLLGPAKSIGNTALENIKELPPATCGYYNTNTNIFSANKYWFLADTPHTDSFEQTVEKVRCLLTKSINRQLAYDNSNSKGLGTFLSGGLDSSIISSVAQKHFRARGEVLKTFSVDYVDNDKHFKASIFQPNSDNEYVDIMQDYLQSNHTKIYLRTDELVDSLHDAVDARGMPGMADIDGSLLLFCKKIKPHIDIALSGECADEIFGGYQWFTNESVRARFGFPWAQNIEYRASFLHEGITSKINAKDFVTSFYSSTIRSVDVLDGVSAEDKRIKQMHVLNYNWFMQTLLSRGESMAEAAGVTIRIPFCDANIIKYLYSVPWNIKHAGGREKGLLRHAAQELLDEKVLWRKKSPYPKTHNPHYCAAVAKKLKEIINNKNSPLLQIANKTALQNLLTAAQNTTQSSTPWYGQLMATPQTIAYFIQINYWLENL